MNFIGSIAFLQKLEICKVGYFYNLTNSKFSKISITQENAIALSKFLIFSGALPRECALNGLDFYEGENFQKLKNSLILLIFKMQIQLIKFLAFYGEDWESVNGIDFTRSAS